MHTAGDKHNAKQIRGEHLDGSPERMSPRALIRGWERSGKKHYGPVEACVSASAATCMTQASPPLLQCMKAQKSHTVRLYLVTTRSSHLRGEKMDKLLLLKLQAMLHIYTTSRQCLGSFALLRASASVQKHDAILVRFISNHHS